MGPSGERTTVESFGRLGREAARFLSELGDAAAARGRVVKADFVRFAREELSCALCRGNARLYSRSLHELARVVGRVFTDKKYMCLAHLTQVSTLQTVSESICVCP